MHARPIAVLGALAALATSPAAAQNDPLGVGREFGAYVNPSRAADMIRECDAQAHAVEGAIAAYQAVMADHQRAKEAHQRRLDALNTAKEAVAEAESQLALAKGAEADRLRDLVLEPRRLRYRALADALPKQNDAFEASYEKTQRSAETTVARLRAAGLSDSEMAARPENLVRSQNERCKRMRAWAELGRSGSAPTPGRSSPGSGSWPEGARVLWTGEWSCIRESTAGGSTLRVTINAKLKAFVDKRGVLQSYLSTDPTYGAEGRWGSARSISLFSPLEVSKTEPLKAIFANSDEVGETRATIDAIDSAAMSADGARFRYERRYATSPGQLERLECDRTK